MVRQELIDEVNARGGASLEDRDILMQWVNEYGVDIQPDDIKRQLLLECGSQGGGSKGGSYSDFADGMSASDRARYIINNEAKFFSEFSKRASVSGLDSTQVSEAYDAMRAGDYNKMASIYL